jgi:hypothetical protein
MNKFLKDAQTLLDLTLRTFISSGLFSAEACVFSAPGVPDGDVRQQSLRRLFRKLN